MGTEFTLYGKGDSWNKTQEESKLRAEYGLSI